MKGWPRADWLRLFAIGYVALDSLHFIDHLRQGRILTPQVYVAGTAGLVGSVLVLALVLRRHPVAPLAATVFGALAGLGVFAAHIMPNWYYLSDSYLPLQLDLFSWIVAVSVIVDAAALALVGASMLRADRKQLTPT
ncbi:MAG: hypothetical protein QOE92_1894 [Chloroflexota bacterium]|jgi:quinol-cytochrome oxidoreductase complex cytochrome b subunit|nr:hypothetical protein [Chloroflexota bacterium]